MILQKVLISFLLMNFHAGTARADINNPKLKNLQFKVKSVGLVKVKYEEIGEPVAEPQRLEIFVTCETNKKTFRFKVFRMCDWTDYTYDKDGTTLELKLTSGRVQFDTGDVHCDQYDTKVVDFEKACEP